MSKSFWSSSSSSTSSSSKKKKNKNKNKKVVTDNQVELILHGLEKILEQSIVDIQGIRLVGDFHNIKHVLRRVKESLRLTKEFTKGHVKNPEIKVPFRSEPNSLSETVLAKSGECFLVERLTTEEEEGEEQTPEVNPSPLPPAGVEEAEGGDAVTTHSCNEEGCEVCGCRTPESENDETPVTTTPDNGNWCGGESSSGWEDEDPDWCSECMKVHTGSCDLFDDDDDDDDNEEIKEEEE